MLSTGWQLSVPAPRNAHTMVYDRANSRIVMFGGAAGIGSEFNDVWELRCHDAGCDWHRLAPTGEPPLARWGHAAVVDCEASRMIVFGGSREHSYLGDTWELSLVPGRERWLRLGSEEPRPPARCGTSAVWCGTRKSMVVFGGLGPGILNDTWEFRPDVGHWTRLSLAGESPAGRSQACAAFDDAGNRMVMTLGVGSVGFDSDVWALDLALGAEQWRRLAPAGVPPSPRAYGAWFHDQAGRKLYVFGGWSYPPMVFNNDLHCLDLDTGRWRQINLPGPLPRPRRLAAGCFDPLGRRLVMFGGEPEWRKYTADLWRLPVV